MDSDDVELAKSSFYVPRAAASSSSSSTGVPRYSANGHLAWGFVMGCLLTILIVPSLRRGGGKTDVLPPPDVHDLESLAATSAVLSLFASQASSSNVAAAGLLYLNETLALDLLRYSPAPPSSAGATPLQLYLSLSRGFDAQRNQAYCGLASASTVLNSLIYPVVGSPQILPQPMLNVNVDIDPSYSPYFYATQTDILGACDVGSWVHRSDKDYDSILTPPYGLTLRQVGGVLGCHLSSSDFPPSSRPSSPGDVTSWTVTTKALDPSSLSLDSFRAELLAALSSSPLSRLVVNFRRAELGQAGGGHWSPLAGYDAGTDSFLVLDVAKYKMPPFFVRADKLYGALATVDDCGIWNWPDAQATLTAEERTATGPMTMAVKDKLGCKPSYRGFITITPNVYK